jgi:hypothetical protein
MNAQALPALRAREMRLISNRKYTTLLAQTAPARSDVRGHAQQSALVCLTPDQPTTELRSSYTRVARAFLLPSRPSALGSPRSDGTLFAPVQPCRSRPKRRRQSAAIAWQFLALKVRCAGTGANIVQCRACRVEMRLMQVVVGDTMRWAPCIERQIFKCPTCSHEARQVVFGALPISTSGVATRPQIDAITVRTQRPSEAQLAAKLSSRQPRDVAATAKASAWARAVEKAP